LLRMREAADYLNVPERTLREYWQRWGLTAYRVGRTIQFRERELNNWLGSNRIEKRAA
jgi:excisionase family DNA binding protein